MKATITTKALLAALKAVSPAVAGKSTLPVLVCVKLTFYDQSLDIEATNLEAGISTTIKAVTEDAFTFCANYKDLVAVVSAMATNDTISIEQRKDAITITGGRTRHTMPIVEADEFPVLPSLDEVAEQEIAPEAIRAILDVAYAKAADDSRPVLAAVGCKQGLVAAADGFRMAAAKVDWPATCNLSKPEALGTLNLNTPIRMRIGSNIVRASDGITSIVMRLVDGNFPDVERVIPQQHLTAITVSRAQLISAVSTVGITAEKSQNIIKLERKAGVGEPLTLMARGESETTAEINCAATGEGVVKIAVNYRYLLDMLKAMKGDEVELRVQNETSPLVAVEGVYTYVIMPMSIREAKA